VETDRIEFIMSKNKGPFTVRFMTTKPRALLELTNTTETTLRSVEILTVFLRNEVSIGSPSRAHIRFDRIVVIQPNEKAVVSHTTWSNGRPSTDADDQLDRLTIVPGAIKPYVLDISWEDPEGATQFQRIPVGHQ
jgi:hypothetical protein